MVDDNLLIALIKESLEAETRPRRLAALVLLDVLRKGERTGNGPDIELIEADAIPAVADEIRALAKTYRLWADSN